MKNLTLGLGRRFLVSRKRVGFVSWSAVMAMLGVAVGCFAVLAAIAVLNGFTNELEERVSDFESDLRIANISLDQNLQAKIKSAAVSIPEIEDASFYLERKGIVIRDDNRQLVTLKAVESDKLGSVYRPFMESELGRPLEKSGVVMGTELAARLQVRPGDRLRLVSPTSGQLALGFPTWGDVEVQGVFRTGIPIFDDRVCFIPMEMGKQLFRAGTSVDGVDFLLREGSTAKIAEDKISALLPEELTLTSWREQHGILFSAMELEKLVGTIVLSLIIIVASFGIASTLIMLIMEKVREIGILRAMGATRRKVARIFAFQGIMIGGIGAVFGMITGITLIFAQMKWGFLKLPETIYLVSAVPMALSLGDVVILISVSGAIISLASVYPARVASRLSLTEAVRFEK